VSACWGHPQPRNSARAHRLCIITAAASTGSEQPPAPRKQQLFGSKAQGLPLAGQQSQRQSSSKGQPIEEGEEEGDWEEEEGDEYEYLDEGDEGWEDEEEDEDWEDEAAEDDESSAAPAALQIPQDQQTVAFTQVGPI
jgi:hypothetical protein